MNIFLNLMKKEKLSDANKMMDHALEINICMLKNHLMNKKILNQKKKSNMK